MKVKAESDAPAPGFWTSEAKEQTASLPESVQNAISGMTGVSYSPIAVLGTQIVAGKKTTASLLMERLSPQSP